jgi:hypothetical protein
VLLGTAPAELPSVGYRDELSREGAHCEQDQPAKFTEVGYGTTQEQPPLAERGKIAGPASIRLAQQETRSLRETGFLVPIDGPVYAFSTAPSLPDVTIDA